MPDFLGNVQVPDIIPTGTFPVSPDYPVEMRRDYRVEIHRFGSGDSKIEQRFLIGTGARIFTVRKYWMREAERIALRDFWEQHYGPYGAFYFDAPNDNGIGTTQYVCRFANEPLSWETVSDWACSLGVTLIEIPQSTPSYTLVQTVERFPPSALQLALLDQLQEIIPLIRLKVKDPLYPTIYLSDRRCVVGGQLYLARLLEFAGISQSITGESDEASFTFGNADRVMRDLVNDVDIHRATLDFSLFHVGTGIKLDLWRGEVIDWSFDSGPVFRVRAADGLYELNLPYPTRRISRTCWKTFNDGIACPFAAQGALDLVHFPGADPTQCDKGYETPNGCLAHGMKRYYGGIVAEPQGVRVKDNSTGVWGFGRSTITSVSMVADSIYDEVVPEIYTDSPMPVNAKIAAGRDESDFYEALGIVGEGPLGAYGIGHKLDGQYHHGFPGPLGLREIVGTDPAGPTDWFSLDQSGDQTGGDWRKVFSGNSTYKDNFAAGTAFVVIRRSDQKGLQLSRPSEHSMEVIVAQGLGGWVWSAPGARSWQNGLTNPVWIAVNMILKARGLRFADAATCEQIIDVPAAIAAAAICDQVVPRVIGSGFETQFKFRGVFQEEKPLRDWIQEVLGNCLGYYTFAFGRFKPGIRVNSSAVEAFTIGNIIFQSLELAPIRPSFNHITANFADEEFEFVANSITLYDVDHANLIGGPTSPLYLKSQMNLAGTSSKSQAARIITTRLREELGGITVQEWKAARHLKFRTTVLALNTEPGMVCSMTHPDMPGGSGEFRVTGWRLNRDYSIEIEGRTTTDDMYNLVVGPKPADVSPSPFPRTFRDLLPRPPFGWLPYHDAPLPTDPIFDPTEWTFGLAPRHETAGDGSRISSLVVTGKLPVNVLSSIRPPVLNPTAQISASGGSVKGGRTYYVAVCAKDGAGRFSASSEIVKAAVPAGTDTNVITVTVDSWPDGAPGGYAVFAGENRDRLSWQFDGAGAPFQIVSSVHPAVGLWGLPDPEFDRLRLRAKRIIHSGVFGQQVGGVTASTIKVAGAAFTPNQWANYVCSIIGIWNPAVVGANGEPFVFLGTGLNDLTVGGTYSSRGRAIFEVEISSTGTPDTFRWRKNGGNWSSPTAISGSAQPLSDGITVQFAATTGHTQGDRWIVPVGDSLPILNYRVVSNDSDTLTLSPGHNPLADGVKVGDVVVMRFRPTIVTGNSIGDPNVINCFQTGGATNDESGHLIRIIAGTGRGQVRKVVSNTATAWTIEGAWDVMPDTSSIFIVEEARWDSRTESTPINNLDPLNVVDLAVRVDNLIRETVLVQAVAVDGGSHEAPDADSPLREIYLFGAPGTAADWEITIVDDADPLADGTDLANHYRVSEDASLGIDLLEWTAQLKTAPTSGSLVVDIDVSDDNGNTWQSIFGSQKPTIPASSKRANGSTFAIRRLNRDDILRYNLSGADGTAAVLTFILRGKKVKP